MRLWGERNLLREECMARDRIVLLVVLVVLAVWAAFWWVETDQVPPERSDWDQPVYQDGRWRLSGIAEEMIRKEMFGVQVDLLRVRYGKGVLWAAAGAERLDGVYESFIEGAVSRDQAQEWFAYPRWVTLSIAGEPAFTGKVDCSDSGPKCHIARLADQHVPLLLDGDEQYTESVSAIFVRTGVFPEHYLYGFLTWDITPGKVIEPGLEGN